MLDAGSGLSGNNVTAVIRDKRGLMWIGTHNGLNLYAGYNFIHSYPELNHQSISCLAYDSIRNAIWVGTLKGLYLIQPDLGMVKLVNPVVGVGGTEVASICVVPDKEAFVLYQGGLLTKVDYHEHTSIIRRAPAEYIYFPLPFNAEKGWLLFPNSTNPKDYSLYDIRSGKSTVLQLPVKYIVTNYGFNSDTLILIAADKSIHFVDLKDGTDVTPSVLAGRQIENAGLHDKNLVLITCGSYCGNYYASTPDTIYEYSLTTGKLESRMGKYNSFFGRQRYFCNYRDRQGTIWLGTNLGLYKVSCQYNLFDTVLYDDHFRISARGIVEEENGDLYVGGTYGLFYYSAAKKKWEWFRFIDPATRTSAVVTTDLVSFKDHIYISSFTNDMFFRFDKQTKQFETDFFKTNLVRRQANSLFVSEDSLIWIGTSGGLMKYDPKTNELHLIADSVLSRRGFVVMNIKQGSERNTLWLATNRGVYLLHIHEGVLLHLHRNSSPALSSNDIYFVEEDSLRNLWITTNGGGINLVSPDRSEVRYFNREMSGLSSDIVYGMLTDDDGKQWFSTSNGLSCFYKDEHRFYNYYTLDGLCNNDFNYNSYYKGRSGRMYFGTVNGVNAFNPSEFAPAADPDVRLFVLPVAKWDEQAKAFTMISNFKGDGDEIILHSPNASLVINLGMTDYEEPVRNVFSYRILGLFDDWLPLSGEPVLRLHGIPYGRYTVQVRGMTARGLPADNLLHFSILVKKPFYNSLWFYLSLVGLVVIVIYVFFWVKYRNLKRMQQLRLQISSNLHDEVGSILTTITLYSDDLIFSGETGVEKDIRLKKIAALSREATVTMGDILWAVDARNDMPGSLSERIREYAEEVLLPRQVNLKVNVDDVAAKGKMPVVLRQQLYLIFKEAVNNMLKHSDVEHASIVLRYINERQFLLRVENDGLREHRMGVRGQGLKNMKMRSERMGALMCYKIDQGRFIVEVRKGEFS